MDTNTVANLIVDALEDKTRHIVAIAGPPASGKSTLAKSLHANLQARGVPSKVVPMDGFHLDNSILRDRGTMHRKGAPHTFDASGFIHLIKRLSDQTGDVAIPIFDRELDKSIAAADVITGDDQILLVEGNYLLINQPPWNQLKSLWDQTIFISCESAELENRLVDRWIDLGHDAETAKNRAQANDLPNAAYVLDHSDTADIIIA